ncbi:MAG: DNA repair protein RadC [Polyangiaceae bacterium]|nr:DNA repair protein RadC [Polyangiaceae bacterium]
MKRIMTSLLLGLALVSCKDPGTAPSPDSSPARPAAQAKGSSKSAADLSPAKATEKAPEKFKARFQTSKGAFTIEVNREWSPAGADRFYNLVKMGFFDDVRFFRAVEGFMVQFGLNGNPEVSSQWRSANINDDPVKQSNKRGYVTFAKTGMPNSRSTQIFINYGDNSRLDGMGFAPFGQVIEGMDVVDNLHKGYGEGAPMGNGPNQGRIQAEGNAYLDKDFPKLDRVTRAEIVPLFPGRVAVRHRVAGGSPPGPGGRFEVSRATRAGTGAAVRGGMTITVLQEAGGPSERARVEGPETLGDAELLALLLGPGAPPRRLAQALLEGAGGLSGLMREGVRGRQTGLNEARALRVEAALELGRRAAQRESLPRTWVLSSPERVAAWGRVSLGHLTHEELWLLALDGRHGLLAARRVAQGGSHGCAVRVRDVLRAALRAGASGFVLVHNHPSGDPTPSPEDTRMSVEVARAAEVVGLSLLDHIVVGAERHASLFELGLLGG